MTSASFFRRVQDAPWYDHFLAATLPALAGLPGGARVLDIGTGPGLLVEMGLARTPYQWEGADVDAAMLDEARARPALHDTPLHLLARDNGRLPFDDASYDAVVFCSVLYLLPDPQPLIADAWRLLRPGGRLVALTSTGRGRVTPGLLRQVGGLRGNATMMLWRNMTAESGRRWAARAALPELAGAQGGVYEQTPALNGLAVVEVVSKPGAASRQNGIG